MKKPNITKGPWKLIWSEGGQPHFWINAPSCQVLSHPYKEWTSYKEAEFCIDRWRADAKAISAVPKLLREAYLTYLMLLAHPEYRIEENQEFVDRVNGLHKALEKAGYEL